MGYRRGYFRKDGTYVNGYFANTGRKRKSYNNSGCLAVLLVMTCFFLAMSCSNHL